MTTENKLNAVINSKQNIKDAIEAKGVTVGSAPLSKYAEKIGEIETGVNIDEGISMRNPTLIDGQKFFTEADIFSKSGVIPRNLTNQYVIGDMGGLEISHKNIMKVKLNDNISEVGEYGLVGAYFDDYSKFMTGLVIREGAFSGSSISSSVLENASILEGKSLHFSTIEGDLTASESFGVERALEGATINGNLTLNLENITDSFAKNSTMQNLIFSPNVKTIGYNCFEYANIGQDGTYNLIIPEGVSFDSSVVYGAFSNSNIRSATTPTTMVFSGSRGYTMFSYCSHMIEANLKGGGEFERNFFGCSMLQKATLGSPGKPAISLDSDVFEDCSNLTQINIYVSNPNSPGLTGAPWGATNATIKYLQA